MENGSGCEDWIGLIIFDGVNRLNNRAVICWKF